MQFLVAPDQYAFVLALFCLKKKFFWIKNYCMGFILSSILFLFCIMIFLLLYITHYFYLCKKYTGV